jgi:choline dehydrogenase-like flavoprotein
VTSLPKYDHNDDSVVVVIGSGAGGGTLANELCQKGINVVVLEAGKRESTSTFVNNEWGAFEQLGWHDKRTSSGAWRIARDYPNLPAMICKTVGGSTTHWAGVSLRFRAHELKAQTTYGNIDGANLLDWPISLDELAPFYDRAEDKLGVTRTHGIPGLPGSNNFKVFYNGAKQIGYRSANTSRLAINSKARDGRAPCQQLGFCMQGCKMGAKWSTLYTEIPAAEATGKLELREQCHASRIEHDDSGKVTGVVYFDADGNEQRQLARIVCLAGNAIETPRLLLLSESSQFPDGLANSSGELGCNYQRHTSGSVFATFDEPIHMYRGTSMAGIVSEESNHEPRRGFAGGYQLQTLGFGLPLTAAFIDPGGWGRGVTSALDDYANMAGLWIVGEDLPQTSNRITLNRDETDQSGLPVANVHYDDHRNDIAMRTHGFRQGRALYESIGAKNVYEAPPFPSSHNMGTCRMSEDRYYGVVNKWGQTHDIPNLFISDGSQFTTSGAGNPTLTIVALAIRQADWIALEMGRRSI